MNGSTTGTELVELVDQVREDAERRGAIASKQTFTTADGEVEVDYRAGDWLRITFTGDAHARTHVLSPNWPRS